MTVAITIISGAALFSFVNTQTGVSAKLYGESVGTVVNYLGEQFVVVDLNFTSSSVSLWIYNNGRIDFTPTQVLIFKASRSMYISYNATHVVDLNNPASCTKPLQQYPTLENPLFSNVKLSPSSMLMETLTLPCTSESQTFNTARTYYVSVLGSYGNAISFYKSR